MWAPFSKFAEIGSLLKKNSTCRINENEIPRQGFLNRTRLRRKEAMLRTPIDFGKKENDEAFIFVILSFQTDEP